MRSHQPDTENRAVWGQKLTVYSLRIRGHLGVTCLAAFPQMVSQRCGNDSVLTGVLPDQSALFGVLAQIEALSLDLIEVRRLVPRPESPDTGEASSPVVDSDTRRTKEV
jgi:hypothetical protein